MASIVIYIKHNIIYFNGIDILSKKISEEIERWI